MLPAAHQHRVRDLFDEGVETPASSRAAWMASRCRGEPPEVADAVRKLLDAHDEAGAFLTDPTIPLPAGDASSPSDPLTPSWPSSTASWNVAPPASRTSPVADDPKAVGPYTLIEELGHGGFGSVWLAEQTRPVRRRVALKLIKAGMDTRQVVARFEAERRALALMDHPHIARVLEAGETTAGRPYFVMELVDGVPITAHCRGGRLTVARRLALFLDVCSAVQHAHQKGVIHRDLKPGNVLVAGSGEAAVAKVIDFGIAKALWGRLTDATLATDGGHWLGTPEYMSPEQAGGADGGAADTRSDVYGLGALLYELLSGRPPFDGRQLRLMPADAARKVLREEDPPPPSRRVLTPATEDEAVDESLATADARSARSRHIRGDLDWIVARALAKEPDRRYPTADALAEDVKRHLVGRPVHAGPVGWGYRTRKFVRRNRRSVATAAVLVAGGSVAAYGLVEARVQAGRAAAADRDRQLQHQLADAQSRLAAEQGDRAVTVRRAFDRDAAVTAQAQNLLLHLFSQEPPAKGPVDPAEQRRLSVSLDVVAGRLAATPFVLQPDLEVPARVALGRAYLEVRRSADDAKAEAQFRAAFRAALALEAARDEQAASALNNLGVALLRQERYADARDALQQALGHHDVARRGPTTDAKLRFAILRNLATTHARLGERAAAATRMDEAAAAIRRAEGPGSPQECDALKKFAALLDRVGDVAGAKRYRAAAEEVEKEVKTHHPSTRPEPKSSRNLGPVDDDVI